MAHSVDHGRVIRTEYKREDARGKFSEPIIYTHRLLNSHVFLRQVGAYRSYPIGHPPTAIMRSICAPYLTMWLINYLVN